MSLSTIMTLRNIFLMGCLSIIINVRQSVWFLESELIVNIIFILKRSFFYNQGWSKSPYVTYTVDFWFSHFRIVLLILNSTVRYNVRLYHILSFAVINIIVFICYYLSQLNLLSPFILLSIYLIYLILFVCSILI